MRKALALLFVGSALTLAACTTKPKTEEAGTKNTMMSTDTSSMATDSASSTMASDSAK